MATRGALRKLRRAWLAVLLAVAVVGLAACAGSSSAPQVASLKGSNSGNNSTGAGDATKLPTSNPTRLLDDWAVCIRSHGDPSQADPVIDANKDIQINMYNVSDTLEHEVHASTGPCSNYLVAAQTALRDGQPFPADNPVQDEKFAQCMRTHGVPNYPNPSANGDTNFNGTGVNPNSASVQSATKTCDKQVGERYYPPGTEMPGVVIVRGCNAPPGKQCPSGGPGGSGGNG